MNPISRKQSGANGADNDSREPLTRHACQ
jgi:hypothetical protein